VTINRIIYYYNLYEEMKFNVLIFCFILFFLLTNDANAVFITANIDSHNFEKNDLIIIHGKIDQTINENQIAIEIFSPTGKSSLNRIVAIYPNGEFNLDFYANYTHGRFLSDISGTYDVLGTVLTDDGPITMTITTFELNVEPKIEEKTLDIESNGGCLIATATYGSEMAPQVQLLRETRDNIILKTESGLSFMTGFNSIYYSFSPTIADWERESPEFKEFVKIILIPLLTSLSILNYVEIDSEIELLGIGISLIIINLGMYFIFPVIAIFKLKNFKHKNIL